MRKQFKYGDTAQRLGTSKPLSDTAPGWLLIIFGRGVQRHMLSPSFYSRQDVWQKISQLPVSTSMWSCSCENIGISNHKGKVGLDHQNHPCGSLLVINWDYQKWQQLRQFFFFSCHLLMCWYRNKTTKCRNLRIKIYY